MYSVVLATMLTTSAAAPDWCWGCKGCHGCWGCHGCHGCWGCRGCHGCWGCGCGGCGCWGCYGCGCYGCGCWGCGCGGCYGCGCYGCYGCGCGGAVVVQAAPAAPKPAEKKVTSSPTKATIVMNLAPDARLYVDGDAVDRVAAAQSFQTPDLEPGREYFYTFKAEAVRDGQTVSESRRVSFRAGEVARVEFTGLAAAPAVPARLTVRLPADAKLYVDDVLCPPTSGTRSFETPKLEPGKSYAYSLRAEVVRGGRTHTDSRRVLVQAGKQASVDFGEIAPVQAAQR